MANYLVTGAVGFIGSNIAQRLLNLGHQVVTIDNLSTGYESCIPKQCLFIKGIAPQQFKTTI
jgi:UDP-glucose 4-epimerase